MELSRRPSSSLLQARSFYLSTPRDREVLGHVAAIDGIFFHRKKLDGAPCFLQGASLRPKAASIKQARKARVHNLAALARSSPAQCALC